MPERKAPMFVRDATGLVRSLSGFDLFNLSYGQIGPTVGIIFVLEFVSYAFPQSNAGWATLLVLPLLFFGLALVYSMLGAAMPRTGGDYVYASRTIHGTIGFLTSWLITICAFSFIATNGYVFPSAVSSLFGTVGQATGNASLAANSAWFLTNTGILVTGTILLVVVCVLMIFGRTVWGFMRILFVLTMIGTVLNIVFLASASQSSFANIWNSHFASAGFTYDGVIQTAVKNGYAPGWNWRGNLASVAYSMFALNGFTYAAYTGGETKSASKNLPLSILGSLVAAGVIYAAWCFAVYHAFGFDFFSAANYLANCCASTVPLPMPVSMNWLFILIPQNTVLMFIEALAFVVAWIWICSTNFIACSRNLFAWSFDRIAPARLADVNDRFHSPIKAVIVTGVVGEILLVVWIYTSFAAAMANSVVLLCFAYLLTCIAAILFPYTAKSTFELSPAWVKRRFGRVPAITLVGVFALVVESIIFYSSITNAFVGGTPASLPIAVGVGVLGIALYCVAWAYRKREGLDLSLIFKILPPE